MLYGPRRATAFAKLDLGCLYDAAMSWTLNYGLDGIIYQILVDAWQRSKTQPTGKTIVTEAILKAVCIGQITNIAGSIVSLLVNFKALAELSRSFEERFQLIDDRSMWNYVGMLKSFLERWPDALQKIIKDLQGDEPLMILARRYAVWPEGTSHSSFAIDFPEEEHLLQEKERES